MLEHPLVLDDEVDLLAFFDINAVGDELHLSVIVAHGDLDDACRSLRIAGLAG